MFLAIFSLENMQHAKIAEFKVMDNNNFIGIAILTEVYISLQHFGQLGKNGYDSWARSRNIHLYHVLHQVLI